VYYIHIKILYQSRNIYLKFWLKLKVVQWPVHNLIQNLNSFWKTVKERFYSSLHWNQSVSVYRYECFSAAVEMFSSLQWLNSEILTVYGHRRKLTLEELGSSLGDGHPVGVRGSLLSTQRGHVPSTILNPFSITVLSNYSSCHGLAIYTKSSY
jgi:hypothetical protein